MDESIDILIKKGALFVVNHSGGKDSQAMLIRLRAIVPESQLLVIHATLGEVEWTGTIEHIENTIGSIPLIIASNPNKDFFGMVEHRKMWPSPKNRQCTSDLKRGPVEREIRKYLKENPQYQNRIINCMGLRAEESSGRAKATVFKRNDRNSKAGREWYDWLPVHKLLIDEVFNNIKGANELPHWAYSKGMSRLSCCFCIMASKSDLRIASKLMPELFKKYCNYEKKLNMTLIMPSKGNQIFLPDIVKTQ